MVLANLISMATGAAAQYGIWWCFYGRRRRQLEIVIAARRDVAHPFRSSDDGEWSDRTTPSAPMPDLGPRLRPYQLTPEKAACPFCNAGMYERTRHGGLDRKSKKDDVFCRGTSCQDGMTGEHIHRQCDYCGGAWHEMTAEATKARPKGER